MKIFGLSTKGLEAASKSMDFVSLASLLTTSNIANRDTPGYRAKSVEFEKAMGAALQSGGGKQKTGGGDEKSAGVLFRTDSRHFPTEAVRVTEESNGQKLDGNSVNLDREITKLSELEIKYSAYSSIAGSQIGKLKRAIDLKVK